MPRPKKKKYSNYFGKSPFDDLMPKIKLDPEVKKGISVVIFLAFGVISLLSLFGASGTIGQYINTFFTALLGYGHWYSPLILLWLGYLLYAKEKRTVRGAVYLGLLLFILSIQGLFHVFFDQARWDLIIDTGEGGGYVGMMVATLFVNLAGFWASLVLLFGILLISLMLMLNKTLNSLVGGESIFAKILAPFNWVINKIFKRGNEEDGEEENDEENEDEEPEEEGEEEEESEEEVEEEEVDEETAFERREVKLEPLVAKKVEAKKAKTENPWHPSHVEIDFPIDYLSSKVAKAVSGDIKNNKELIRQTLENFGVLVEMGDVEVGPTVSRYTLKPADGVRLSRITELNSNLALALAAKAIRIEAPIPGKALVGIEVPNPTNAVVGLREILTSENFENRKSDMMLALGKDVSGNSLIYDLTDTPHLLVAGTTRSGKSVGINSIIMGLLYQNSPDDLRFIMVDPKRVELPIYDGIPHLLCPVVTTVPKAINALKWCLNEMDRRLDIMSEAQNKNIETYNKAHKNNKMPYIVVIIDELADLMMLARKEIENSLIRLLQMARAAGIHLILATQSPRADIITGLIRANMPARIAFAVKSGIESRIILDEMGAEKLLGKGDMLFLASDMPVPRRAQGAFLSEQEIKKIVDSIKRDAETQYISGVTDPQKVTGLGGHGMDGNSEDHGDSGDVDVLFEQAKEEVINSGKASTSYLQRRMSIGYGRAARIIDLLEDAGIIGPANGSKPREIMVSKEQYESMISQGVSGVSIHDRDSFVAPENFLMDVVEPEDEAEAFEEAEEEILEEIKDKKSKKKVEEIEEEEEVDDEDAEINNEEDVNEDEDEEEVDDEEQVEESKKKTAPKKKIEKKKVIEDDEDEEKKDSSSDEEYERLFSR